MDSVTFALAWLPTPDTAGWYSALDQGWFEEENIDVAIVRGFGSGDTAQRLATDEADFGIVDMAALVPLRVNEDLPVVAIASYYAEPFHAVFFRANDGIEEPRDLEGRTIACSAGNANLLMFEAFAHATGVDGDAVEWQLGDPTSIVPAFVGGQTDGSCSPVVEAPLLETQTDAELAHFAFADYGVTLHSQMVVTAERTLEERPDLVERFLRAAFAGLEFAIEHPDDALEIVLSHEPDLDPDVSHATWELTIDRGLMTNEDTERHGIGYISPERMQETFDTLVDASDLDPGDYTVEDLYTTEFLP